MLCSRKAVLPSPHAPSTRFTYNKSPSLAARLGAEGSFILLIATIVHYAACTALAIHTLGLWIGPVVSAALLLPRLWPTVMLTEANLATVLPTGHRFTRYEHTIGRNNARRRMASKHLKLYSKSWWPVRALSVEEELERIVRSGRVIGVEAGPAILVSIGPSSLHLASVMVGDDGAVQLSNAVPITTLPLQGAS